MTGIKIVDKGGVTPIFSEKFLILSSPPPPPPTEEMNGPKYPNRNCLTTRSVQLTYALSWTFNM